MLGSQRGVSRGSSRNGDHFNRPLQYVLKPNQPPQIWHQHPQLLAQPDHLVNSMVQSSGNEVQAMLPRSHTRSPLGFHEAPQQCLTDRGHVAAMAGGGESHWYLPSARDRLQASLAPPSPTQQQAAVVTAIAPHDQITPFQLQPSSAGSQQYIPDPHQPQGGKRRYKQAVTNLKQYQLFQLPGGVMR